MTEAEKLLAEAEWKPIETAPRGGEWFMARSEHGQTRAVHYADEYDRFPISHDGVVWSTAPVEWMPISVFPALLARLTAQVEAMRGERLTARLNAEALAEIKATLDGNSDQPVQAIMDGLLAELAAITEAQQ